LANGSGYFKIVAKVRNGKIALIKKNFTDISAVCTEVATFTAMEALFIVPVKISEHYAAISSLMRALHEHELLLYDKTASWDDIETSYMRHVIDMQETCDGMCLMAYMDNVPAGFIFGYLEDQDDSRIEVNTGRELYVSDGYVDAAHRRHGIYKQLNERLEQHYIALGVKRILRFTRVNNTRMIGFMEQQGYEVTRLLFEKWVE
jgi:ribosomal protein S18 acetylase RimI-like enzyme